MNPKDYPKYEINRFLTALLAYEKRKGAGPVPPRLIPLNNHKIQQKARRLAKQQGLAIYVHQDAPISPSGRAGWLLTDKGRAYLQDINQ